MIRIKKAFIFTMILTIVLTFASSGLAYKADTLRSGSRGNAVREMQLALISLGYLGGTADGIFGTNTENAVKKFQKASRLTADGLAGSKTLEVLYKKAGVKTGTSSSASSGSSSSKVSSSSSSSASSASSGSLFGGNYETMRNGSTGARVKTLQQALISLGFLSGKADGIYGKLTGSAVKSYQKANGLTADGLAGKKTLASLEAGGKATASPAASASNTSSASSSTTVMAPNGSSVKLLHWVKDVKPTLKSGQTLTIYEPSSGRSWKLKVFSCGRHCDAEPWTSDDTASMVKAFGGEKTWSQKAVYIKLPSGVWTIGSTHDMPHESQSIKDNDFNGHLCVHFLRDMAEAQENDPKYGVSNQETIRTFWKKLTGETISI